MAWKKKYRRCLLLGALAGIIGMILLGYVELKDSIPDEIKLTEGQEEDLENVFANPLVHWDDSIPVSQARNFTISCSILDMVFLKNVKVEVVPREWIQVCGSTVGIYMETEGILIVDTQEIKGKDGGTYNPAANLVQPGDYITAFNNNPIEEKQELIDAVAQCDGEDVNLSLIRKGEEIQLRIQPVESTKGEYKLGIWVRDDTQGIGTLTYMDEEGRFGALGHGISDVDTGELLDIKDGELYQAQVIGIQKGSKGTPGELSGLIHYEAGNKIGEITTNCENGIYGTLSDSSALSLCKMEIGHKQEMTEGEASILCSLDGNLEEYQVKITKIDLNHQDTNKSFVIEITDPKLLSKTGGIVQGMSGSPVIQNGKLVGAVTHVFVQDSTCGYGIFIENMIDDSRE